MVWGLSDQNGGEHKTKQHQRHQIYIVLFFIFKLLIQHNILLLVMDLELVYFLRNLFSCFMFIVIIILTFKLLRIALEAFICLS